MAQLITGLEPARVRANLERVREDIASTGGDPAEVQVLAAVKYLAAEELGVLAEAGIRLVGENAQRSTGTMTWTRLRSSRSSPGANAANRSLTSSASGDSAV